VLAEDTHKAREYQEKNIGEWPHPKKPTNSKLSFIPKKD
jgi:hypothetical protein